MKRKPVGDQTDKGTPGTTWKAHGSRLRRSLTAVALTGALALGIFGAARHGQSHNNQTQEAGSTWSFKISLHGGHVQPQRGNTWS